MRALEYGDPAVVGRYRILARLGAGGMAVVYFGRSPGGRDVAVKVTHTDLARDPEFRDRFRREVAATRAAGGRFSPPVIDADPDAEIPWLVTEFLPSVSLREAVRTIGPLPDRTVWPLAAGLVEALLSIHAAGVLHLDLKPANVLLTAEGPRVIDFGIARRIDAVPAGSGAAPAGSAGFMSPEQASGPHIGPSSDVYALGATLAYASTGSRPYDHLPAWPDGAGDPALRHLILGCLDRDPQVRPTLTVLAEAITAASPVAGPIDAGWLPTAVTAELTRRAGEARNPPVGPMAAAPYPPVGPMPAAPYPPVGAMPAAPYPPVGAMPAAPYPPVGAMAAAPYPPVGAVAGRGPGQEGRSDPPGGWWTRRRVLLLGIGALASLGGAAGAAAVWSSYGREAAPAGPPPSEPVPLPSPTEAPPRMFEISFTGNVPLTSLTYTVNDRSTTLRNVRLPWRQTVPVPALPQESTWRLRFTYPPGEVSYRLLMDGFQVSVGTSGSSGAPGKGDVDGSG